MSVMTVVPILLIIEVARIVLSAAAPGRPALLARCSYVRTHDVQSQHLGNCCVGAPLCRSSVCTGNLRCVLTVRVRHSSHAGGEVPGLAGNSSAERTAAARGRTTDLASPLGSPTHGPAIHESCVHRALSYAYAAKFLCTSGTRSPAGGAELHNDPAHTSRVRRRAVQFSTICISTICNASFSGIAVPCGLRHLGSECTHRNLFE